MCSAILRSVREPLHRSRAAWRRAHLTLTTERNTASFEHAVTLLYLAEVDPHANIAHSNTAVSIEWIYAPWLTTHENAVGYGHQKLVQLLLHELEQAPTH